MIGLDVDWLPPLVARHGRPESLRPDRAGRTTTQVWSWGPTRLVRVRLTRGGDGLPPGYEIRALYDLRSYDGIGPGVPRSSDITGLARLAGFYGPRCVACGDVGKVAAAGRFVDCPTCARGRVGVPA